MKSVAICNKEFINLYPRNKSLKTATIENQDITVGLIETPDFDYNNIKDDEVLIEKLAFSSNYRDKTLLLQNNYNLVKRAKENKDKYYYSFFGSEFVGNVIKIGDNVKRMVIGDRVIPIYSYPYARNPEIEPGVLSNFCSQRYEIFHQDGLIHIPDKMPNEIAASFTIGAQTVYGMINRINPFKGANVLVTSAKSNTSLMAISALKKHQVNVYALTTSIGFDQVFQKLGVKGVVHFEKDLSKLSLFKLSDSVGGFDFVIDPFFDLHIGIITNVMNYESKYVTCGCYDQYAPFRTNEFGIQGDNLSNILNNCIKKNIHLMGNCIGYEKDIMEAVQDYLDGKFSVIIDSVFSGMKVAEFLNRTYNDVNRLGKVVYKY